MAVTHDIALARFSRARLTCDGSQRQKTKGGRKLVRMAPGPCLLPPAADLIDVRGARPEPRRTVPGHDAVARPNGRLPTDTILRVVAQAPPSRKILKPTPNCERAALRLQAAERAYGAGRVPSSAQVCGYAEALIISGRYEQCLEVCRRVASPDAATAYLRAESEWRLGDLSGAVATVAPHARDERCRELMQFVQFLHVRAPPSRPCPSAVIWIRFTSGLPARRRVGVRGYLLVTWCPLCVGAAVTPPGS